jgi:hypothetical protein
MPSKKPAKSTQACYLPLAGFLPGLLIYPEEAGELFFPEKSGFFEKHGGLIQ